MAPIKKEDVKEDKEYDLFVIGGGSGGLACARRAAGSYGANVGLAEGSYRLGGTCVNVGCVPKKVMWYAADAAERLRGAPFFGFGKEVGKHAHQPEFDWGYLKTKRDAYIKRLNGIYEKNLTNDKVDEHNGYASFIAANEIQIKQPDGNTYNVKAKKVVVAVGGRPTIPSEEEVPGASHGIDSDGFFDLEQQPKRVAVVGAGYIAVEMAGIFHALGSETHVLIRHDKVLRTFDPMLQDILTDHMSKTGINVHKQTNVKKVEKTANGLLVYTDSSDKPLEVDVLLWSVGRHANTEHLGADKISLKLDKKGDVIADDYQETNVPNVYSIGDVSGRALLTPVAIAAGRRLSNRLFGPPEFKDDKLSYENIPSVVFSHPTIGSIGMTQPEAEEKFGKDDLKIYNTSFKAMNNFALDDEFKNPTSYKLICVKSKKELVVGLHIIGEGSDEILQGFSVAIKMGATKSDFDSAVAIHPTSAEELVTLR